MEYYKKYLKYRSKYIALKKQLGGINAQVQQSISLNMRMNNKLSEGTVNSYKKKLHFVEGQDYESDDMLFIRDRDDVGNFDENHYFIRKNIEYNIQPAEYYNRIRDIINRYPNINLYIAMAPLFIKEYYIPSFIKEYLRNNPEERFVIVIIHSNFDYSVGNNFNINELNQFVSEEKQSPYGQRLNIIHIRTNFDLEVNDQNIQDFCGSVYRPNKLNILYFGFKVCGNYPNEINPLPPNYLLIGCGFYRYNRRIEEFGYIPNFNYDQENIDRPIRPLIPENLALDRQLYRIPDTPENKEERRRIEDQMEQNHRRLYPNDSQCSYIVSKGRMIDMPEQCKITLDMVNRIINPPVNI
jgi:hypothetical protein